MGYKSRNKLLVMVSYKVFIKVGGSLVYVCIKLLK